MERRLCGHFHEHVCPAEPVDRACLRVSGYRPIGRSSVGVLMDTSGDLGLWLEGCLGTFLPVIIP